ncbi:C4-dicarboxylate ABC transporter [Azorhizobium oxalatiphilum]|uniref:TRAP transporter small permease protein n=1 Tax=Azorhizobium oxalatiphilum TaxID=980631 RepID=A0A917BZX1_9HYPH|nr:TRAP transporter small permease subunit [Azorhizobium oxalatiphilum]GGF63370.1 C4-dicarboxylate ABC transporter [Azorhizobium oxalatiphilum]
MNALLKLSRGIDGIGAFFGNIADWLVLAAAFISATNATVRYLVNYSSNSWLEIQWYMFGGMVMLGAAYTLKKNEHVRVDLVYGSLSDRGRLWIDTIGFTVFFLPIIGLLTYLSFNFFWGSFVSKEVSMNAGGLILWPAKALLPAGFALLFLQGISELIKRVAALTGRLNLDTHYEKPVQ